MRRLPIIWLAALGALWPNCALAQFDQDSHTVTVEAAPFTGILLLQRTVDLVIGTANVLPGPSELTAVDESTILAWRINRRHQKLTVQTDQPDARFTLRVRAVNNTAGTPMPDVTLTGTPQDLMRDLGRSIGFTRIRYTATAAPEQGSGTEEHLVTFTITSQ